MSGRWATLTEGEKRARQEEYEEERRRAAEFNDHEMEDPAIAAYIRETLGQTRKLLAEGKIMSRWAEDVQRYRHRRDCVPQPGKQWPPKSNRVTRAAASDGDDETELGDCDDTPDLAE